MLDLAADHLPRPGRQIAARSGPAEDVDRAADRGQRVPQFVSQHGQEIVPPPVGFLEGPDMLPEFLLEKLPLVMSRLSPMMPCGWELSSRIRDRLTSVGTPNLLANGVVVRVAHHPRFPCPLGVDHGPRPVMLCDQVHDPQADPLDLLETLIAVEL